MEIHRLVEADSFCGCEVLIHLPRPMIAQLGYGNGLCNFSLVASLLRARQIDPCEVLREVPQSVRHAYVAVF